MNVLPPFTDDGVLSPGDYPMTLDDLRQSRLVQNPDADPEMWDPAWWAMLVENLAVLVSDRWQVGVDRIFIDGSFVEDKPRPNDIDGYFECDAAGLASMQRTLNALNVHDVWRWDAGSRRWHPDAEKPVLPMWWRYRVELFPHYGQIAGFDVTGNPLEFPPFFRRRRDGLPKGIVQIVR